MRIPRIYVPIVLKTGDFVTLDSQASVHISRVLRLKKNDPVVVFNGQGGEYEGVIAEIDKRAVSVVLNLFNDRTVESPLLISLVQAVSRSDRMDFTLQKAVELGVHDIIPLISQHTAFTVKGTRADKKHQHWQGIVHSACEQSGRTLIPTVQAIVDFSTWLDAQRVEHQGLEGEGLGSQELNHQPLHNAGKATTTKILLDHRADQRLNQLEAPANHRVMLLVGPEGGFSESEISAVQGVGFTGVGLGPRVLRTETAALSVISALQLLWGDFGA